MSPAAPDADSAGVPWAGRSFHDNPHSADDGSPDPALWAALSAPRDDADAQIAVVRAFGSARLLIPLVAEAGQTGTGAGGHTVDKTQELSIVTVAGPDGRRVQPVFTGVETLARWDAAARPVPVDGRRAALAAADDDTELIVIDPGSPTEFVIRRPALWAIGQDIPWEPSSVSAEVYAGLVASIGSELAVLDLSVASGDPTARLRGPELVVRLHLMPGLDAAELNAVLSRLAARWAADDRVAVLVDSLTVKLVRAEA